MCCEVKIRCKCGSDEDESSFPRPFLFAYIFTEEILMKWISNYPRFCDLKLSLFLVNAGG